MAQFFKKNKHQTSTDVDGNGRSIGNAQLKILALSGTEGVTKNMTIYEYGNDIIVVDCGIGFPDADMYGVDVVIPDFTYLLENKEKVKGVFITHGHEDHLGAVPYLLRELNAPIYANALVQGFIKGRIKDRGTKDMAQNTSFHLIGEDVEEITLGNFKVSTFRVNHSVPNSLGIAIDTPQGKVLHMADYKVDWSPVLDKPIDIATISKYGEEGVLCLLSDCLGATTDGYSQSEQTLNQTFHDLLEKAEGRQLMITTISSNISRIYQIVDAAVKAGRKVVLGGRSIHQSVTVARGLGLLPFDDNVFVNDRGSNELRQSELVYIVAGCYGQQGSTLDRISRGEHDSIILVENSLVVFSADPSPPGVGPDVEKVMDNLTLRDATVIYSQIQENLHVSGHGPKGDLTLIASIVKPKYFIPIGGTITKARAYKNMIEELGFDRESVFELLEGDNVLFSNNQARLGKKIETKQVYVDGKKVGDVGATVIRDRSKLSDDGVFVVIVPISKTTKEPISNVEIVTRGFIYVKESKQLMGAAKDAVNKILDKNQQQVANWGALQSKIEKEIGRLLYRETGRSPMVIVHSVAV